MSRYFIEIAYKGTVFNGIQIQLAGLTVQGEINRALSTIFKQEIQTTTASRTDAGVHAQQNFCTSILNTLFQVAYYIA